MVENEVEVNRKNRNSKIRRSHYCMCIMHFIPTLRYIFNSDYYCMHSEFSCGALTLSKTTSLRCKYRLLLTQLADIRNIMKATSIVFRRRNVGQISTYVSNDAMTQKRSVALLAVKPITSHTHEKQPFNHYAIVSLCCFIPISTY